MTLLKTKTGVVDAPSRIIIYSPPKVGKTKSLSKLPDSFILDLESGTGGVEGDLLNVQQEMIDRNITDPGQRAIAPWKIISEFYSELLDMGNKLPFKHLVIDTVDELESAARMQVWSEAGEDPFNMDYGKGYGLVRDRIMKLLNMFVSLGLNLVIVGHRKRTLVEKKGVTIASNDLEVTGKLKSILFAWADCIAFGNRDMTEDGDSGFFLSFVRDAEDSTESGSRIGRLEGRNVLVHAMNGKGDTTINNWDEIFPKGVK